MEGRSLEHWLSKSPEALNFFLNHSEVYPNIAPDGAGYLDATEVLERRDTYFFNFGQGAVLFIADGSDFKVDAYFPRKSGAKKYILMALGFMAGKKIIAEIPAFNLPSRHIAMSFGFTRVGITGAWLKNGVAYDVIRYELEN